MTPDILAMINQARESLIAEIECSDEKPETKKDLVAMFSGMSPIEFLQLRFSGYQQPVDKAPVGQSIVKCIPPFVKRSPVKLEKGGNTGISLLNEAMVQVIWKVRPEFYFNIYFTKTSLSGFKACCCFADIINYLYGRDVCGCKMLPKLSNTVEKQFPGISSKIGIITYDGKISEPYLNTIGFNGQPKQWFLMVNINNIDEWANLRLYGTESQVINDVMNLLFKSAISIVGSIYGSGDQQFIDKLEKYIGFSFYDFKK